jgi:hypothetical protein
VTAPVVASPQGWQVSVPSWVSAEAGWLVGGVMVAGVRVTVVDGVEGAVLVVVGGVGGGGWC